MQDNQQGPTVQLRELCLMLSGSLDGRGVVGRMDTWMCMPESLWSSPDTITTLLIGSRWRQFSRSVVSDSFDPMDCSLPGSSVHGILKARILEWVAISFSS